MTAPAAELDLTPPDLQAPTVLFHGLSLEQVDAYEQRIEQAVRQALRRVMRQVTANLGDVTTAAALVADAASISPDDLSGIGPLWHTQVEQQLQPVVAQVYRDSAGAVHSSMVDAVGDLPRLSPIAAETYLAQSATTFDAIGAQLWETARTQLIEGIAAGEDIPMLAARLRETVPDLTARQATLVARTQVNDAANAASYATAQASGLDLVKGWETTADLRTRETHLFAGSRYSGPGMVPMAEMFMVGGWPCERPHDPSLPAAERYNCRCTIVYGMREGGRPSRTDLVAQLQAEHQRRLAQLAARHAQRLEVLRARHEAKMAALAARAQERAVEIDAARVAYGQRVASLRVEYEARRASLEAEHARRLAVARGEEPPTPLATAPVGLPPPEPMVPIAGQPTLVPVREALAQAQTIPEVRRAFIAEWEQILNQRGLFGTRPVRFSPTSDIQTAREHAEGLLRGIERFPRVRLQVTYQDLVHSYAETEGGLVRFASAWSRQREAYLASLRTDGARNAQGVAFHPMTIASPQGIALHEFGHALHYSLSFNVQGGFDYSLYGQVAARARRIVAELANERGVPPVDLIRLEIGEYAAGRTNELLGEAFADVMVNGDAASELSRRIFAMLVREYERVHPPRAGGVAGETLGPLATRPALSVSGVDDVREAVRLSLVTGDGLSPSEVTALREFRAFGSTVEEVQGGLRTGTLSDVLRRDVVEPIDSAMRRSLTTRDLVLDRGVYDLAELVDLRTGSVVGKEWIDRAFLSTTSKTTEARGFAFGGPRPAVLRIKIPRGTPAVQLSARGEEEVLLGRGLRLRIVADRGIADGDIRFLEAEILPGDEALIPKVTVDGLDVMELPALRSLATEFEITNASRLGRERLLAELRQRGAMSPEARRAAELAQVQGRAIAEILQSLDAGADLATIVETLVGRAELKDLLAIVRRAKDPAKLATSLRGFATRRGITIPTKTQLKAIQAAERKAAAAAKREAALAARAEKARQAEIKAQVKAVQSGDFSSLTRVGPQGGAMPGGIYEDAAGNRWYVKQAVGDEHARSEALALALYRAAGIDAPEMIIGGNAPGLVGTQVATRWLPNAAVDLLDRLDNPAYIAQIRQGYAVDAWLANWDVVGANPLAGWDNIISSGGRPWRVDAGGALRFRGLGTPKGDSFGSEVLEWVTLRDPAMAERAAQVFAGMTRAQLVEAVARVKALTPARIRIMVRQHGLDEQLADLLVARRADLLVRATRELDPSANFKFLLRTAVRDKKALDVPPVELGGLLRAGDQPLIARGLSGLSPTTRNAVMDSLTDYRGIGYEWTNVYLRQGTLAGDRYATFLRGGAAEAERLTRGHIANIDIAMQESALSDNLLLYRGLASADEIFGDSNTWGANLTGWEWTDAAYTSTTVSRTRLFEIMYDLHNAAPEVLLRIIAPRGINGITLSRLVLGETEGYGEGEILLARGLRYRVVADRGIDRRTGTRVLDVIVLTS